MNLMALGTSGLGLLLTFAGIGVYFAKLMKNKVPVFPFGLIISLLGAIILGAYALWLVIPAPVLAVLPVAVLAGMAIFVSVFFLWVISQKNTPIGNIKVTVGDSLIPFTVNAADGSVFSTGDLAGKRVLLKFYRGSWCPYCSKELTMFDEMKADFDKYGVKVIALSGDTVEQSKAHAERDNLSHLLLSDPELDVVKKYGVEHHKALGADSENIMVMLGLPFPQPYQLKFKSMSIPTSVLVDEHGVIKWIDQSSDYRLRANQERILSAMEQNLTSVK
jgi:peroxiredoxin